MDKQLEPPPRAATPPKGDSFPKKYEEEVGVDSGFISSEIIINSESDLKPQEDHQDNNIHHKQTSSISSTLTTSTKSSGYYSRLDSGVEISDSISGLNISSEDKEPHPHQNNELHHWTRYFSPDSDGDTTLHLAILSQNDDLIDSLISMIPHPSILDFQNNLLQTALHVAVLSTQGKIVRKLVAAGARVDMKDRNGNTPIHIAASKGDLQSLHALSYALTNEEINSLKVNYTPFAQPLPQCIDTNNYEGQSPLHLAALSGHSDVIRALNWIGALMNNQDGKGGRTAIHYTVERNHIDALKVLLNECNNSSNVVDLEIENYAGLTAYQLAACNENNIITKLLSDAGAKVLPIPIDDDDDDDQECSCCNMDSDNEEFCS